jgi:hypothetical protein
MNDHAHDPATGIDLCAFSVPPEAAEYLDRTEHLTLEQHGAYVVLRDLIETFGFHEVLNDLWLICGALDCSPRRWQNVIAPAIVPVLEAEAGETA